MSFKKEKRSSPNFGPKNVHLSPSKARSHLSVAELNAAKIKIKLHQLLPSCSVATLHNALICFTDNTIKLTNNKALLRSATLKCE